MSKIRILDAFGNRKAGDAPLLAASVLHSGNAFAVALLALIFAGLVTAANAQTPLTTRPSFTDMLTANCTATHVLLGGAVSPGCGPNADTGRRSHVLQRHQLGVTGRQ
jgi:hypothetical protein